MIISGSGFCPASTERIFGFFCISWSRACSLVTYCTEPLMPASDRPWTKLLARGLSKVYRLLIKRGYVKRSVKIHFWVSRSLIIEKPTKSVKKSTRNQNTTIPDAYGMCIMCFQEVRKINRNIRSYALAYTKLREVQKNDPAGSSLSIKIVIILSLEHRR